MAVPIPDPEILLLLFGIGLLAGLIDAIAGGGGLLTLPALLAVGLPPLQALATNKLTGTFGTFTSSLYFIRRGYIDPGTIRLLVACTFAGSALGTFAVQHVNPAFLNDVIPFMLILVALYFGFSPRMHEEDARQRIGYGGFALFVGFGVGFYDGFFGPGAGSFFAIGCVFLLGFNLVKATAQTKVLNFTSNLAALLFFTLGGQVVWSIGLCMGCGQVIGARLGARLVIRRGAALIRPLIVLVCILISLKLLVSDSDIPYAWLRDLLPPGIPSIIPAP